MRRRIEKLGFDIVHGCQLRCVGCPNSVIQPKIKQISVEDFSRCLAHLDVGHIELFRLFNFGEPLLHKDLPGILAQFPRQLFRVGVVELSTNAQYHDFDMLAETLSVGVLGRLVVSCDGDGTPESYEAVRPPAKWEKLLEFLRRAKELRDRHAPEMQLVTRTICEDAAAQARWRSVLEPLGWTPEFRGWLILPGARNMTGREPKVPNQVCRFLDGDKFYVDYDGTVVPCCAHPRAGVLGDLKTQTWSEILLGEARARMRRAMVEDRAAMPLCGECAF